MSAAAQSCDGHAVRSRVLLDCQYVVLLSRLGSCVRIWVIEASVSGVFVSFYSLSVVWTEYDESPGQGCSRAVVLYRKQPGGSMEIDRWDIREVVEAAGKAWREPYLLCIHRIVNQSIEVVCYLIFVVV